MTFLLLLAACDDAPGEWSAIVYPDKTNRAKFDVTARFKTFDYCKEAAIERMKAIEVAGGGDYECGFRCDQSRNPRRMNVCEQTRR